MTKKNVFRKVMSVITVISPVATSKIYYKLKTHNKLNLIEPKNFNEKLMWLKLNEYKNNELIIQCADKYRVRDYIVKCGCKEILNDIISVFDKPEDINFKQLPNQFVLKINNAAGYNIICSNKKNIDEKKVKKTLKKWYKNPYWKFYAELQYKPIKQKIVCEKYMVLRDNKPIDDYKIYCFNGNPEFCMVCIDRNLGKPKYYFMDTNWNLMRINPDGKNASPNFKLEKPKCIDEMYKYAKILSKPFKFVRVDFYDYNGKTIFGELTFTPAGCADPNYTIEANNKFGDMIKLN